MWDYRHYDALDLAQLVKKGDITPQELLDQVISRTESLNPKLNFISVKSYDYAKNAIKAGLPAGPFYGVPFLLKDLGTLCKNTVTTQGSKICQGFTADLDSYLVRRFKNAGLVIFGKTSTPEFGLSFTTEPAVFGPCRNPWNPDLSAGGSSGGAACAVAARVVPVAHASDGGGSIRVPAGCCGVFGLKPTRGRVSMGPIDGEGWAGLAAQHVISLSVRDSAALLDCIQGPETGDPYHAPCQAVPYTELIKQKPGVLKIAYTEAFGDMEKPSADAVNALRHTAELCEALGHQLIEATPKIQSDVLNHAFRLVIAANCVSFIKMTEREMRRSISMEEVEPSTRAFLEHGKKFTAADYAEAIFTLHYHARRIAEFFQDIDVLLTPTTAQPALPIGALAGNLLDFEEYNRRQLRFGPYTALANISGQPAMSVPLYWTDKHIPLGSQFIAKFGDEAMLFRLAAQLEEAQPWFHKEPPL